MMSSPNPFNAIQLGDEANMTVFNDNVTHTQCHIWWSGYVRVVHYQTILTIGIRE